MGITSRRLGKTTLWWICLCWLGAISGAFAQTKDTSSNNLDTLSKQIVERDEKRLDQIGEDREDSTAIFYQKLKKRLYKHKLTKRLYDALFREPYRKPVTRTLERPADPYQRYNGRFIGDIRYTRLDPFGPRVNDTLRPPANWVERTANSLHATTKKYVIRKGLLFKKGDRLSSLEISDNERILRETPNLLDARIYVLPRPGDRDTVDILVVTQDVLSVSGGASGNTRSATVDLNESNFFGLGHEVRTRTTYRSQTNPFTESPVGWGFRGLYRVPYIGNTFITGQLDFIHEWNHQREGLLLRREFLSPDIKYAGGLEVSRNRQLMQTYPLEPDSGNVLYRYNYKLVDAWLGRAFRLNVGSERFRERARLVTALRASSYDFFDRPLVTADTNQILEDREQNFFSIGISNRNYLRDVQVFGFGRTEDIPYGSLFSITGGVDRGEFKRGYYLGSKLSRGRYYKGFGYLLATVEAGSFVRAGDWEQGVVRVELNYFSRLLTFQTTHIRQFLDLRFVHGIGRFDREFIDISGRNGIRGIGSAALRGSKGLVLNLETVVFTPITILGFQLATFAYADLGIITPSDVKILDGTLYQGYGIGLRVRNENLAFNTFQFRLGIYPNIPGNSRVLRTDFSGFPRTRLPDFGISAPDVVPFR
ncbi:MAG: hypothetical protein AVDCRST_MAG56-763 [uncultured Cytophagales bacterium]|uniref:Bacterial surface antigen (D15) domain-containing protein n=1 Tax=uncultured Cytophagales bacterium TaxID=158755 RepID=A0A6J4HNX1_9SPHI|nr:MAG: hypothetical protein AVDCRST_MAG56-763 [uncultured Cytophagales bacterium]